MHIASPYFGALLLGGGEFCKLFTAAFPLTVFVKGVLEGVLTIELFELLFPLFWLEVDIFSGIYLHSIVHLKISQHWSNIKVVIAYFFINKIPQ